MKREQVRQPGGYRGSRVTSAVEVRYAVVELPGHFRISLTANDTMIEQALPGFAIALQKATWGR
jgi:hypothetical protein